MIAKVGCDVYTCGYNVSGQCGANAIQVDGSTASQTSGTFCSTFQKEDSMSNAAIPHSANGTAIGCEVHNCVYNEHEKCDLSEIQVGPCSCGSQECDCQSDTCCTSFRCK